jgi:hypothetical protein
MVQMKDAHKILGLKEGASKNEIERRYTVLFKKFKSGGMADSEYSFDEITRAYNLLMGYEQEINEEDIQLRPNRIFKLLGINEKKANNFLHYYKFHILIGIVIVIVLVSTIRSCIMKPPIDLNMAFIGEFYYSDTENIENKIRERIPDIRGISIDSAILSDNMDGEQEYAMQMKVMVLLAAADVDIYILDRSNFEKFAKQGAFAPLDNIVNVDKDKNSDFILKVEEDIEEEPEEHLYGINAGESKFFEETDIYGEEKIISLGIKAKNHEYAVLLIKSLINEQ